MSSSPQFWNLVWLKKDLRLKDHEPFFKAQKTGPCFAVYVVEDEWLKSPEYSPRHLQFITDCLKELSDNLLKKNIKLLILRGSVPEVFEPLTKLVNIGELHSHQETGLDWTFKRDLRVKDWAQQKSIPWFEHKQFAVHRGLTNRNLWNQKRGKTIERPILPDPEKQNFTFPSTFSLDPEALNELFSVQASIEEGGEKRAHELLESFLSERGENYQKEMSSPNTAYTSCSRLSSHLTYGSISLSQISHELKGARKELQKLPYEHSKNWKRSLKAFESRLWWHCHFIQKLEREPNLEFHNTNRGYDGMREDEFNEVFFKAWCKGETGYPFIDACMRALHKEGWINFRMRAMLISFASYQLWLHWRKPAIHLAKLFTDFEPGIHFSQVQMQSGVTGINTIRIYSPLKQSLDQDPNGDFIREYCPELSQVDTAYIHEPHKMPPLMRQMAGLKLGETYPTPIVEHKTSYNEAKSKAFSWRNKKEVKTKAREVYRKHGSRKNSFFPEQHRKAFGNLNYQTKEPS